MEVSSREAQGSTHADEASHHNTAIFNPKALDILLKYLEQTLKKVDTSILLAFTVVAFLLIPGLEGTFSVETREGAIADIPYLDIKAELLTAALFGLVLYCVFCFRAASQVAQVRKIVNRLRLADAEILDAALHFPSVTTSNLRDKRFICISLAILGMLAWILIFISPLGLEGAAWGAPMMVIPPGYLLYVLSKPLSSSMNDN
jgi:hypothetical protein